MTSKPQGSSKRVLSWQVTMDQLASLSHTYNWYGAGLIYSSESINLIYSNQKRMYDIAQDDYGTLQKSY